MNALYRHPSGIVEPCGLPTIDGELCSPGGAPLQPTGGVAAIRGWGTLDGEAYEFTDGVRMYFVPKTKAEV